MYRLGNLGEITPLFNVRNNSLAISKGITTNSLHQVRLVCSILASLVVHTRNKNSIVACQNNSETE